jgi:hypothetical protein
MDTTNLNLAALARYFSDEGEAWKLMATIKRAEGKRLRYQEPKNSAA